MFEYLNIYTHIQHTLRIVFLLLVTVASIFPPSILKHLIAHLISKAKSKESLYLRTKIVVDVINSGLSYLAPSLTFSHKLFIAEFCFGPWGTFNMYQRNK